MDCPLEGTSGVFFFLKNLNYPLGDNAQVVGFGVELIFFFGNIIFSIFILIVCRMDCPLEVTIGVF
jgi:hypothetical protein